MKIKPIILDRIQTRHTNYIIDLKFDSNVTFVTGDSGVGKSAVYSFLQEYSSDLKPIKPNLLIVLQLPELYFR